jgi:hypothetical protein
VNPRLDLRDGVVLRLEQDGVNAQPRGRLDVDLEVVDEQRLRRRRPLGVEMWR